MNGCRLVALIICLPLSLIASAAPNQPPDPRILKWVLPVRSAQLTPGYVPPRTLNLPGFTPLFLVGEDAASLEWLSQHAEALKGMGASGMVVEVTDVLALKRIQDTAPELSLWPVSGDDIAKRLELEHYPVLITPTGLEQ